MKKVVLTLLVSDHQAQQTADILSRNVTDPDARSICSIMQLHCIPILDSGRAYEVKVEDDGHPL